MPRFLFMPGGKNRAVDTTGSPLVSDLYFTNYYVK
jgi:hypothetical protein